ncbi:hypothetical protein [Paenibacillus eucommiae]|uniref:Transposase/invertase (TIGR01784 family) n=1 Tax=Paenibacillus eucommiae TaxID=1355755 RepID=A0ABS4J2F5_9BACL|nr:hypothetical protein [Paenibacillus eucommiae]MBP1994026.1 putative transposase/invertase (TIGR01784 family) [Paenibacillus eucommiae]
MAIPEHPILHFQFLKVELKKQDWRRFIDSDNPVAAALLAKMGYTKKEKREVRFAFLQMMLRLREKLDPARFMLIMSVADLYFMPNIKQDEEILQELSKQYPEEGAAIMDLMPAWKRWGYEEGIEAGKEKGKKEGKQEGKEVERNNIIHKLLDKGFSPEEVAETLEFPVDEVRNCLNSKRTLR